MSSCAPLSHVLAPYSTEIAAWFEDVPTPQPLDDHGMPHVMVTVGSGNALDFGDASTRIAILAGPEATIEPRALHSLAAHLGAPVANTWGAKGIYPWDDPHHMGTCGLQRDDFSLLGFAEFDLVLAVGVDPHESPRARYALTQTIQVRVDRDLFDQIRSESVRREYRPEPNELYTRVAAIAQPGYVDESFPRHPARAVMDLKQSLGPSTRVTAQPGSVGLWIARTFPTDRMGSVIVPAIDRPGVAAAVGLVSALQGTDTVCVVRGPVDERTRTIVTAAHNDQLPLRLAVWDDDIDWSRTDDLIAAAGPLVAWTDPSSRAFGTSGR